jgi:hypothetical protein
MGGHVERIIDVMVRYVVLGEVVLNERNAAILQPNKLELISMDEEL